VIEGDKENLPAGKVDSILANINRNVLIDLMPDFNRITQKDSILMLSGILEEDTNVIRNLAEANGFKLKESRLLDGWMMMLFKRN
jgi:ribosomal protein L11 methyltransferase